MEKRFVKLEELVGYTPQLLTTRGECLKEQFPKRVADNCISEYETVSASIFSVNDGSRQTPTQIADALEACKL